MRVIPLAQTPSQAFTATIEGVRWGLRFYECEYATACDIERDGEKLLSGVRVLSGEPIIPYRYLQSGNFLILTNSDQLPFYERFGISQILVYISAEEIALVPAYTLGQIEALTPVEFLTNDAGLYLTTDDGVLLTNG